VGARVKKKNNIIMVAPKQEKGSLAIYPKVGCSIKEKNEKNTYMVHGLLESSLLPL